MSTKILGLSGINLKKYGSRCIGKWEIKSAVISGKRAITWGLKVSWTIHLTNEEAGEQTVWERSWVSLILQICTMQDLKQEREKSGPIPEIQYPWKPAPWRGGCERADFQWGTACSEGKHWPLPFPASHALKRNFLWLQQSCVRCDCLEKGWKYSAITEGKWKHERWRCYW